MGEAVPHEPLGATAEEGATRFVVTSAVAERVQLCLYDDRNLEQGHLDLEPGSDGRWRALVPGVGDGQRYGFRVHGPGDPARGLACDPAKLLQDPAARRLVGDLTWSPELVAPGVDSARFVPRSVVVAPPPPVDRSRRPGTPWDRTVVYEAHVGHLTARHDLVGEADRGRYGGLCAPPVVDHLQRLGVTALELLPVQHFVSERRLVAEGRRNVWGYNPLAWGAPHAGYASPGGNPVAELRAAVAALHDAGIEVWLDVVYNHTCEGTLGEGPILSWRGFDNLDAYRLRSTGHGLVDDDVTGCGNSIDTRSATVRRLIVETLARWVTEIGIDGFRFDLAATLVRGDHGPTPDHPLLAEIAADPALADVKLVAEPWDVGLGGYALGSFPSPWREWNDRFRDDARDLWRGEPGRLPAVAQRITGSGEAFRSSGRPASTSVNAVATHDGFTLADLVTFDEPTSGGHGQRSWGGGRSGPTEDEAIQAGRRRRQRALLASVVLAQGVPMIHAGDEVGRSQAGQADGYTLEPGEWGVPWPEADWDLAAWTAAAVALRHEHAALRWDGWLDPSDRAIRWLDEQAEPMTPGAWHEPGRQAIEILIHPTRSDPGGTPLLVLVATGTAEATFVLPPGSWWPILDAAHVGPPGSPPAAEVAGPMVVAAPGLVVLRGSHA